ncbi:hypothetical protein FQN54_006861 [Arachnomyces sp. PD_36]|nr:hypothetical protein FQN54_006861 [Arachnomyces sp. PD_36]
MTQGPRFLNQVAMDPLLKGWVDVEERFGGLGELRLKNLVALHSSSLTGTSWKGEIDPVRLQSDFSRPS